MRPQTAKPKEEANVFYKRHIPGGGGGVYRSTTRDNNNQNMIVNDEEKEEDEEIQHPVGEIGGRNERISKTIAESENSSRGKPKGGY